MKPHLIIVPTPIGNLGDMSIRAIEVLKEVDVVLAEDTRTSGRLLQHFEIEAKLRAFHMHNEHKKVDVLVDEMAAGTQMALVSDAGTPRISDPGYLLVSKCLEEGLEVECLPGATAFVPALVVSGFPTDRFSYEGFLPQKKGRQTRIKEIIASDRTTVLYESPHRVVRLLKELIELGIEDRPLSISRELSKKFEETRRGRAVELLSHFENTDARGEFVFVISAQNRKKK